MSLLPRVPPWPCTSTRPCARAGWVPASSKPMPAGQPHPGTTTSLIISFFYFVHVQGGPTATHPGAVRKGQAAAGPAG